MTAASVVTPQAGNGSTDDQVDDFDGSDRFGGFSDPCAARCDNNPWWALLTVVGYAGAFVSLAPLLRMGASIGAVYGIWASSGVALTAILGALIFGEPFTFLIAVGIAIVIACVVLVETGHRSDESPTSAEAGTR